MAQSRNFLLLCGVMTNRLFRDVVFGPVHSRRLGLSLGINIFPAESKICSFNCIYCECGWNTGEKKSYVPRDIVRNDIEMSFRNITETGSKPDVITFAGNGEPTIHPDFSGIIDDTLELRDKYLKGVPVAVLSNSTMLSRETVRTALMKTEIPILKLDSAVRETMMTINNVSTSFSFDEYVNGLIMMKGRAIIQTMLVKGTINGVAFDNSTAEEVEKLTGLLKKIEPKEVQIYTLHRVPPLSTVFRIDNMRLKEIESILINKSLKVHLVIN